MNEKLLQFIWAMQYFNRASLCTEEGDELAIISPGKPNTNQGPDFTESRIRINDTTWVGNIELHVNASDWNKHHHDADPNYGNIILHVVWRNDAAAFKATPPNIPVLELQSRVSNLLLTKYDELLNQVVFIPCENNLEKSVFEGWQVWKEQLVFERLERKAMFIHRMLQESHYHWEETLWWLIAKGFGGKINGEVFERVAKSISLKILGRHKHQLQQIEALLFGQAGLLEGDFAEDYPLMLQKEYRFLKKKYGLERPQVTVQFLRMRPGGFPTIRLAQLAALIQQSHRMFAVMVETENLGEAKAMLAITANDYWHYHFRFDEPGPFMLKTVGKDKIHHILINAIIPILYAYAISKNIALLKTKAITWIKSLPVEKNQLISSWMQFNLPVTTAFDSQALIELKTNYCEQKRCLECMVGRDLLTASA